MPTSRNATAANTPVPATHIVVPNATALNLAVIAGPVKPAQNKDSKTHCLILPLNDFSRSIGALLLMLTNKGWVDVNGSNSGGRFGKPRGGREKREGGDGLEGPGGQLSMVKETQEKDKIGSKPDKNRKHPQLYLAQEEPTEFVLMAYTSGSDTEANLEIITYQLGLEYVEAQLIVHQKNEVAYEEKIAVLEFEVKDKDKTGLAYGDQFSESDSEVLPSVFNSRSSDGDDNPTNDRFKTGDGYHAVPLPLTGNYMPPLADLSFAGLDDSIYRPIENKASASISKGEPSVIKTRNISVEIPKVDSVRTSGVIIKDWVSDDEDTLVDTQVDSPTTVKPSFKKIEFTKARNEYVKSDKQADKSKMVTQNSKPEWSRHVTIVHQTKDLHTADYTQLYDFLKYNQKEVDELKAERLAKTQDPLALMANSNNPYAFPATHQDQSSFNQNYLQQPMPNPKYITDLTTAMNMALTLMAKSFKLNYSTPTNNNQ
nr:hypothetical protein [Tanacetum cinerariifolium]